MLDKHTPSAILVYWTQKMQENLMSDRFPDLEHLSSFIFVSYSNRYVTFEGRQRVTYDTYRLTCNILTANTLNKLPWTHDLQNQNQ